MRKLRVLFLSIFLVGVFCTSVVSADEGDVGRPHGEILNEN